MRRNALVAPHQRIHVHQSGRHSAESSRNPAEGGCLEEDDQSLTLGCNAEDDEEEPTRRRMMLRTGEGEGEAEGGCLEEEEDEAPGCVLARCPNAKLRFWEGA